MRDRVARNFSIFIFQAFLVPLLNVLRRMTVCYFNFELLEFETLILVFSWGLIFVVIARVSIRRDLPPRMIVRQINTSSTPFYGKLNTRKYMYFKTSWNITLIWKYKIFQRGRTYGPLSIEEYFWTDKQTNRNGHKPQPKVGMKAISSRSYQRD